MLSWGEGEAGRKGGGRLRWRREGEEQQSVKAVEASPPPSNLRCAVHPPPLLAHRDNCRGGRRQPGGSLVKLDRPPPPKK